MRARGFTLIELLVAVGLMALMAALSWRGLDGMTRAQTQMRQHSDDVLALQAGLGQWGTDLDALLSPPEAGASDKFSILDWDGRALRLLRRGADPTAGLVVVAWSRRVVDGAGQWLRWQSPPLRTRAERELAWQRAAQWAQSPMADDAQREVGVARIDQWQIFFFRKDAWSNPLSSAEVAGDGKTDLPDGIRLVLTLAPGQALGGTLTRDWIRPGVGGGK
jgi:general secretion pathway protein J